MTPLTSVLFQNSKIPEFPMCSNSTFGSLLQNIKYKMLLKTVPRRTTAAQHYIPTSGSST